MGSSGYLEKLQACLIVLLGIASQISAQLPEFTSLDCGGARNFESSNGIRWMPDTTSITTGSAFNLSRVLPPASLRNLAVEIQSLRFFPEASSPRKNCFSVPTDSGNNYLIRAGFFYGNYDRKGSPPTFLLSIDATLWTVVSNSSQGNGSSLVQYYETITFAGASSLSVCLLRMFANNVPFINSLEIRSMLPGSYALPALGGVNLNLIQRTNFGGPFIRYPGDPRDRFWSDYRAEFPQMQNYTVIKARRNRNISNPAGTDLPPDIVMRTAVTNPVITVDLVPPLFRGSEIQAYAWLFFAEIDRLGSGERRVIDWLCEEDYERIALTALFPSYTTLQFGYLNGTFRGRFKCVLSRDANSSRDPLLNALEIYSSHRRSPGTFAPDGQALKILKESLRLNTWTGDPCLPIPWNGLNCSVDAPPRVTSLNVTAMNLSGPIPEAIFLLTALTTLDLSHNNFTGPISLNFTSLTQLETLDLGNNKLTRDFPGWLTLDRYRFLEFLSVENNRLNGTFPQNFLTTPGFSFRYEGNVQLCSTAGCPQGPTAAPPAPSSPLAPVSPPSMAALDSSGAVHTAVSIVPFLACCCVLLALGLSPCYRAYYPG